MNKQHQPLTGGEQHDNSFNNHKRATGNVNAVMQNMSGTDEGIRKASPEGESETLTNHNPYSIRYSITVK